MVKRRLLIFMSLVLAMITLGRGVGQSPNAQTKGQLRSMTAAQRKAAAARAAAARQSRPTGPKVMAVLAPGGTPDYFGTTPNYANSPLPVNITPSPLTVFITGGGGLGASGLATVTNGVVSGIGLTSGGIGYSATPVVTIADASGTGAAAIATVDPANGVITAITVTSGGSGYAAPTISIVGPGGAGSGATAIATVDPVSGAITAIQVTNGGSGYGGPAVTIDPGTSGGSGATAAATVDPVTTMITALTITNPGSGYFLQRNANGNLTGAIRKFVDSLPGLTAAGANNLGQYIPVAIPDTTTFPGSDYYEISLVEYTEKMHSDLLPTTLRGYMQTNTTDATVKVPSYLGPVIVAQENKPVRVKFTNALPAGSGGNLFIPVDTTVMGAGSGPTGGNYSQNRATLHLHGGATPWISDGTPHQWTTPATESTSYPKGVSVSNVPDMPAPGAGQLTFFYTNQQSARLMFYHDHAYGITRLNVYAGEAAGYLLTDAAEAGLISSGAIPNNGGGVYYYGIPLIIQDKTFLPSAAQLAAQDPTWPFALNSGLSNLWFPHVYMPNQNPWDVMGANAMGRWDYGPWFWPPFTGLVHGPVPNPLSGQPGEPPMNPGTPNPSIVPEGFMDTPLVNGTAYPYLQVGKKAYRFRILNACNDRFLNLQLYFAKSSGAMWDASGALLNANAGEVPMVPAVPGTGLPSTWPTDGRDGGAPNPNAAGPSMIQIGSEGGFLPYPVVLPNTPVGYEYNRRTIVVLNVLNKTLFLGPAERADVIIDFSQVPDGSKIILYNDAPAPVPAFDPRNDYYTGDPDQTSTGGAPPTQPGYGPNTRTIMQFRVTSALGTGSAYNLGALQSALPGAYAASQPAPIVPQSAYNAPYGASYPADAFARIQDTSMTFTPVGSTAPVTMPLQPKAIQELFETEYGRMNAILGVELPFTNMTIQTTIPYAYIDPATEIVKNSDPAALLGTTLDGTQLWKITHNGVDTHAVHFHMFNVQLINRVGWDGAIRPPDPNEVGWKETVLMNPLEDVIVALRPIIPTLPFKLPNSIRPFDVTMPIGSTGQFTNIDPNNNPVTVTNQNVNFGWEYVWHCHLLGHEENDMMRPIILAVAPEAPSNLVATLKANKVTLTWNDNSLTATNFTVQRAANAGFTTNLTTFTVAKVAGIPQTYTDATYNAKQVPYFYRVFASNAVGGVAPGYPNMTANSKFSNVVGPPAGTTKLLSVTQNTAVKNSPVVLTWSYIPSGDQESFTIQRATDAAFTVGLTTFTAAANATTYSDAKTKPGTTYYYRVLATNFLGDGTLSNSLSILAQ